MSSKSKRRNTAEQTVAILESGGYSLPDGQRVSIGDAQQEAVERTTFYAPDGFDEAFVASAKFRGEAETQFEVKNETTFAASKRMLDTGAGQVACLNFASAKHPGGRFLEGCEAQEEMLARASGLYPCLIRWFDAYYEPGRRDKSCLYTDRMIFSPGVPVFRDDDDQLIAKPWRVAVLTSPAPHAGEVEDSERPQLLGVLRERARKVLAVFAANGYRNIVLGAWGCGVFRNEPAEVAGVFSELLHDGGGFSGVFQRVNFAVLDRSENGRFVTPFEKVFG